MSTRTFRETIKKQDEDDLLRGQLPKDFQPAFPVTITEASWLLAKRRDDVRAGAAEMKMDNENVSQLAQYIESEQAQYNETRESLFAKKSNMADLYPDMMKDIEITQILNLRPASVEEAKVLIVSLERFESEEAIKKLELILNIATSDAQQ